MRRLSQTGLRLFAGLAIVGLALTGCGADKAAEVKKASDTPASVVESESTSPSADASAETTKSAALGDTVVVGDWEVKVTNVTLNADAQVHKANMFNDKPKGQYVLVTYEATYKGTERKADISSDLTWSFTTTDSQVNDQASAVTPFENQDKPTEARAGGTVQGQAVFDLPPNMIKGGTLTVEGYNADFDTVYADFKI